MTANKFRFVSPGIMVDEIDNSQTTSLGDNKIGPVVIGRSRRGPSRPVQVRSTAEFIELFGEPVSGRTGGDLWRDGNYTAPTYGAYAATAWLKNNSPLTFIRLLGDQHPDATGGGLAGWSTEKSLNVAAALCGGAFGLFVVNDAAEKKATLAATFYVQNGYVALKGSNLADTVVTEAATVIKSDSATSPEFRAVIFNSAGVEVTSVSFDFNPSSSKYIRKVFNTSPVLTNTAIMGTTNTVNYWLGESYERQVTSLVNGGPSYAVMLGLGASDSEGNDYRYGNKAAKTGWFISQNLGSPNSFVAEEATKLFKIHALEGGEWDSKNLKISIRDIKQSPNPQDPHGTFTVVVRRASDNDQSVKVLEQFTNCNLNPSSPDYIARKIGDRYSEWDNSENTYREFGLHENRSRFIRVELSASVEDGVANPASLPFGVLGPERHKSFILKNDALSTVQTPFLTDGLTAYSNAFVAGKTQIPGSAAGTDFIETNGVDFEFEVNFPAIPLRTTSMDNRLSNSRQAYFGIETTREANTNAANLGYVDLVRPLPSGRYGLDPSNDPADAGFNLEYSWVFTLDDLVATGASIAGPANYTKGSHLGGTSISATNGWQALIENGHNRFSVPLVGGFDGFDITEKEPLRNTKITSIATEETNHVFYTYRKAIQSIRDPEVIEHNIATIPGLTNESLTGLLVQVCEERGDSLAIIDPKGGYVPKEEGSEAERDRLGTVAEVVNSIRGLELNSSYGVAYEPWVKVRDTMSDSLLAVPPSVVALGVMGSTERSAALWFAPAGFTRGGLSEGSAGIPVVGVTRRLTKPDRDALYEANINPIASFPSEGIVIFGQKTLQTTPSAVDRVNVRRLMNYVKKEISRMAATTLFDQNVNATWQRFLSKAEPFLADIQGAFGLTEYRIILDESTTTPDLVDRNVMYAKIFLKPARAIEYIALDFSITNSGASFND